MGRVSVSLVTVLLQYSQAQTSCPCVTTPWTYKGDSFSYCANPSSAKTDWCPTRLNDDGSYTSSLPFTFCEGDVYTACAEAKQANPVPCTGNIKGRPTATVRTPTTAGSTGAPPRP